MSRASLYADNFCFLPDGIKEAAVHYYYDTKQDVFVMAWRSIQIPFIVTREMDINGYLDDPEAMLLQYTSVRAQDVDIEGNPNWIREWGYA